MEKVNSKLNYHCCWKIFWTLGFNKVNRKLLGGYRLEWCPLLENKKKGASRVYAYFSTNYLHFSCSSFLYTYVLRLRNRGCPRSFMSNNVEKIRPIRLNDAKPSTRMSVVLLNTTDWKIRLKFKVNSILWTYIVYGELPSLFQC